MKWVSFIKENEHYTFYFSCGATSTGKYICYENDSIILLNSFNKRIFLTKLDEVVMVEELNKPISMKEGLGKIDDINAATVHHIKNIDNDLSKKSLKDLNKERRKIEREIISNKLKDHTFSGIKKVTYGIPNIHSKRQPE